MAATHDYVLTHKSQFLIGNDEMGQSGSFCRLHGALNVKVKPLTAMTSVTMSYKRGHWKADCHLLKSRSLHSSPRGAGLAEKATGSLAAYLPFIRDFFGR